MTNAKPFIKWVGGKGQLIEQLDMLLPLNFEKRENVVYVEPFIGGGAMFYYMLQRYKNIRSAVINDINKDLIICYKVIRDNPSCLIKVLKEIQKEYSSLKNEEAKKEYFLKKRILYNKKDVCDIVEKSALLIFLNKTCFNGMYRVNKFGNFNVPFGKYKNPLICDSETIYADSELLKNVELLSGDFEKTLERATENTFFYIDPPYRPLSETSCFKDYAKEIFNDDSQIRLKYFCDKIHQRGGQFMLSNSDCSFFEDLYCGYSINKVFAARNINSIATKRGKISEIVVRNYIREKQQYSFELTNNIECAESVCEYKRRVL